jgi:hypothetical protein
VRVAVAVLALFFSCTAQALNCCSNFGEGRIGIGADVIHDKGMPGAILTLAPASLLLWSHNAGLALAYPVGRRNGLKASFGGILVSNLNDDVGTHLNFYLSAGYCNGRWCLDFAHISHGRGVFNIREDAPNHGINFLFLQYRYR